MSPTALRLPATGRGKGRTRAEFVTFFAITFLIAWGTWIPLFLNPALPHQAAFLGLFAPALAAIVTAGIYSGKAGVRELLQRMAVLRFPLRWVVFSALVMPAIYAAATGTVRVFRPGEMGSWFTGNSVGFVLTGFVWLLFITSGEELGWRGFALPRLLGSFERPLMTSLGLGLVWGLWHLPLYLLPGQSAFPLPLFLIFTSLQGVLYTLVFLKTRGSLLPALLLHAGTDIAPRILQLQHLSSAFWIIVDGTLGLVVLALLVANARHGRFVGEVPLK